MTDDKSLRLRVRVSSAISSFRELSGFLRLPRDPRHWELTPGFREAFILGRNHLTQRRKGAKVEGSRLNGVLPK
jgi:hypothetical protein